ncbi:YceI family protein [uncultured Psychroserpens sp.]|uniref:YceI family protein n=1 Tax=uncultured Psychroserpens sp. TaxID=255436 RepID=UPI00261D9253|nr:YceI family protein [uncultured Psychroserpens sp.]
MKKIKIILILCMSILFSFVGGAQDLITQISVDFKIRNLGINVDGTFNNATITTNFKTKDISKWTLSGSVETASIYTENDKRDTHLRAEDYFDVSTYPKITLEAKNFKKISENNYEVTVNLTIKKTTKTIIIPMEITNNDSGSTLKAYFEINRRHYGVGGSSFILSNTVKINVNHTLKKG